MDIKAKIEELVEKIKGNPTILAKFRTDPVAVIEELVGVDLPNEQLQGLANGVKAKLDIDKLGESLGGLGGLFNK
ncbi:MAG: hypothetical protein IJC39_04655, partial [Firmicutes bacterium]|nr:hypothetical protein [Bacillota bacterium]